MPLSNSLKRCDCCGHEHMELDGAAQALHQQLAEALADIERMHFLIERLEVPTLDQVASRFAVVDYPIEVEEVEADPFA